MKNRLSFLAVRSFGNSKILIAFFFLFVFSFLSLIRWFDYFELVTLDWRFNLRPAQSADSKIVIIEITEDSLNALGRWPFDRKYHALLIEALTKARAQAIVFDIIFGEESPSDKELIEATKEAGMVFYPEVFQLSQGIHSAQRVVPLIEGLKKVCAGTGHINIIPDIDGKIRRTPLFISFNGEDTAQLCLLPAIKIFGRKINVPVDNQGLSLINYTAPWAKSFKHYSYLDVLLSCAQVKNNQEPILDLSVFKDKICFIGLTAAGTHDLRPAPLDTNYPMVGVGAQVLNSVLQNKFLRRLGRFPNLFFQILLGCAILSILRKYPPSKSLFLYIGLVFIWTAGVVLAFLFLGVWIDLFYPVLAMSLLYLGGVLYYYVQEVKNRLLINKELSLARGIQRSFLPSAAPQCGNLDVGVKLVTAKQVGGDLYDFIRQDGKIGVFLGDVSGKGMPAALFMGMVMAGFRFLKEFVFLPAKLLENLNAFLLRQSQSGLFVTAIYLVYDFESYVMDFSCGGHPAPVILKKGEDEVKELICEAGCAAGVIGNAVFSQSKVELRQGDVILIYTDGAVEARNKNKEEFGRRRLVDVLVQCRDMPAQDITEQIYSRINKFGQGVSLFDDVTIIVLKVPEAAGGKG